MTKMMVFLQCWFAPHHDDDEGATMIEYALLAALISIVAITAITAVGGSVNAKFQAVLDALT
jgi:pilus assembly protein Flp/PilA